MGRTILKSRNEILVDLINAAVARTALTDVNDASILKHLLAGIASEIHQVYGQFTNLASLFDFQTAAGADLDERAKEILGGTLTRNGAARAVGSLTFSRQISGTVVTIPVGTVALSPEGQQYETTVTGTIALASLTSGAVTARATLASAEGNTAAGTVTSFVTKPAGVLEVTNAVPFAGGADLESDTDFRARIYQFVQSLARCTVDGVESALMGLTDAPTGKSIKYVHVYEPPINPGTAVAYIDDGAGTADSGAVSTVVGETIIDPALGGEEFLYTDYKPLLDNLQSGSNFKVYKNGVAMTLGGTGATGFYTNWASGRIYFTQPLLPGDIITADYQYYTGLMALAQRVVDGDPADRANYPGYRAAGVDIRVLTPTVVPLTVFANITLLEGYDLSTVGSQAQSNIILYVNNLGISGDVIRAELIERIMATPGVYNVNLTDPVADRIIDDDQIARTSASQVTII